MHRRRVWLIIPLCVTADMSTGWIIYFQANMSDEMLWVILLLLWTSPCFPAGSERPRRSERGWRREPRPDWARCWNSMPPGSWCLKVRRKGDIRMNLIYSNLCFFPSPSLSSSLSLQVLWMSWVMDHSGSCLSPLCREGWVVQLFSILNHDTFLC